MASSLQACLSSAVPGRKLCPDRVDGGAGRGCFRLLLPVLGLLSVDASRKNYVQTQALTVIAVVLRLGEVLLFAFEPRNW